MCWHRLKKEDGVVMVLDSDGEYDPVPDSFNSPLSAKFTRKQSVNSLRRKSARESKDNHVKESLWRLILTNGVCQQSKLFYHSLGKEYFNVALLFVEHNNLAEKYELLEDNSDTWPTIFNKIRWERFVGKWEHMSTTNKFHQASGDICRNTEDLPSVSFAYRKFL